MPLDPETGLWSPGIPTPNPGPMGGAAAIFSTMRAGDLAAQAQRERDIKEYMDNLKAQEEQAGISRQTGYSQAMQNLPENATAGEEWAATRPFVNPNTTSAAAALINRENRGISAQGGYLRGVGATQTGQAKMTMADLATALGPDKAADIQADVNLKNATAEKQRSLVIYNNAKASAEPQFAAAKTMSAQAAQTASAAKAANATGNKAGAQKLYNASTRIYQAALSKYNTVLESHLNAIKVAGLSDADQKKMYDEVVSPVKAQLDQDKIDMDNARAAIETPPAAGPHGTATQTNTPSGNSTAGTRKTLEGIWNTPPPS